MRLAIAEAERARGSTGDNPWVGCVIVSASGELVARGHTQGPGEDHAEIAAVREAKARGISVEGTTMYSTLEPCSFHGRTPACSRVIVEQRFARVVTAMRDPHPRVDGQGAQILRDAGIEVVEGVCERDVRRQLGAWVLAYHPHEPRARARSAASALTRHELAEHLAEIYALPEERMIELIVALDREGSTR
jgi:diaminohydroxyphosphoribosylaminopyrimidine deaminase/5-amino-6-(5-phosphoribosylamino)uracil reductase